jgi:hypothetical protein
MVAFARPESVETSLAYSRIEDVSVDEHDGRGLRRARTLGDQAMNDPRSFAWRSCRVWDCSALAGFRPDLREHGFAHVDFSRVRGLPAVLERVQAARRLGEADAAEIRRRLTGRLIDLRGGQRLWILHVARDGLFMRRAGPNGLKIAGDGSQHDAAREVHADQDVEGTPLRQILRGAAPWLFHHDSPDRRNLRSRLFLVNLWIPLAQRTRPLALMDRGTLDRRSHQLRHGLPTDTFLRRRPDMRVNDIWTFLPDERQRWYFTSELAAPSGYAFETLSTPHGSFILPGEDRAEDRYRRLTRVLAAVGDRDAAGVKQALAEDDAGVTSEAVTEPLRAAIAAIEAALAEARAAGEGPSRAWATRAASAAEAVVRTSLEMRAVAVLVPGWPARGAINQGT